MVSRLGFLCCGVGVGVCGVRVCLVPPPCLGLCLFGVFLWLFLCFGGVLWFVLGWCGYCFVAVWLLFCCFVATVLLEGDLSGLGVSFYVLVSLLGGFSVCLRLVFLVVLGDFRREFESPPGYHRCPHGQGK